MLAVLKYVEDVLLQWWQFLQQWMWQIILLPSNILWIFSEQHLSSFTFNHSPPPTLSLSMPFFLSCFLHAIFTKNAFFLRKYIIYFAPNTFWVYLYLPFQTLCTQDSEFLIISFTSHPFTHYSSRLPASLRDVKNHSKTRLWRVKDVKTSLQITQRGIFQTVFSLVACQGEHLKKNP